MKKKVISTILLGTMIGSPALGISKRKAEKMSVDELMSSIGTNHICRSGSNARKDCRTPYSLPYRRITGSAAEKARKISANLEARNNWVINNSATFKTQQERDREVLVERKKELKEDHDELMADLQEAFSKADGSRKKVEDLKADKEKLEQEYETNRAAYSKAADDYMNGDISKREYEKARDVMEDFDNKNQDLMKKIRRASLKAKDYVAEHEGAANSFLEAQNKLKANEVSLSALSQEIIDKSKGDALAIAQEVMSQQLRNQDETFAQSLVDSLSEDGDLAETLLKDLESLEKDLEMDAEQSKLVQDKLKLKYDNSILKGLVDSQIESAITNKCPAIDACMKGQVVDGLQSDVNDIQNASEPSANPQSEDK